MVGLNFAPIPRCSKSAFILVQWVHQSAYRSSCKVGLFIISFSRWVALVAAADKNKQKQCRQKKEFCSLLSPVTLHADRPDAIGSSAYAPHHELRI
ncbi:unnamed protein product [Macrosiphum euphorbiae]|uniref:Uncharacterized protein n=1 Tax=Macrosiphum euphorbiae TaxID=13131 RepID=A0AAV0XEL1_9HEMI|nr:unnamed protein product [Macrosiphum euphorbiae]